MSKQQVLLDYLEQNTRNNIQQHSPEWLEAKKTVIGGSQMSTLLSINPWETQRSMLEAKFGISKNSDQAPMCWGNAFEDMIKQYTEKRLNTKIEGDNCFLPLMSSSRIERINDLVGRVAYSPDGIGVVNDEIVLFEFKAPYSRRTTPTKIPEYYIPQVQTGLNSIDICDYALFIEAEFRVCSWDQLDTGRLHMEYPSREPASKRAGRPDAVGFMVIYGPEEIQGDWPYESFDWTNDLSCLDHEQLDNIIIGLSKKTHVVRYSSVAIENDGDSINQLYEEIEEAAPKSPCDKNCRGESLVPYGIIPWKLMNYRVKRQDFVPGFIDENAEVIIRYTNIARRMNAVQSRKERLQILDEIFPADEFDDWE